ncbi:MAG: single-stranded-DNA-specific exonuclease RecJ [Oscillospiraceae bacterium]|jgi:single-stranded-DNA-specific exonuclease|nr:single-stranded-DNA-specific exonuclease RecJ [Oscillospiraceae bacterium]
MKKWIISRPDTDAVKSMALRTDLNTLCSQVLISRGIKTPEEAREIIGINDLEGPFVLKDAEKAAGIINAAVAAEENICIYGDYDCDGIIAAAMLFSYLSITGEPERLSYYIPEREDGYGMNEKSLRKLKEDGINLIITVDNGISAIKEAELIYELGMRLIVTDHHQPGDVLPQAEAIINPHQEDCPSAFKDLCGAGVAIKLIAALETDMQCQLEDEEFADLYDDDQYIPEEDDCYINTVQQFGDLAAIATVADIVPLTGENRYLVREGLKLLNNTENTGLIALIKASTNKKPVLDASSLGYVLAPMINAAGRFGSPLQALQLLLCESPEEADALAENLQMLNTARKEAEKEIMEKIREHINENPSVLNERVTVVEGKDWHHGVIGIIAARLTETFGKPSFVISADEKTGELRGSARSFGTFSIYECLKYCEEALEKYGGHSGAGGFTVKEGKADEFNKLIQEYALKVHPVMPEYSINAVKVIELSEINTENADSLKLLEPFGEKNPKPVFALLGCTVDSVTGISGGQSTKLRLISGSASVSALLFGEKPENLGIAKGEKYDFLITVETSEFRGERTVSVYVKDYKKSGLKQNVYFSAKDAYEKYKRGEDLPADYYSRMLPDRQELMQLYSGIAKPGIGSNAVSADSLTFRLGLNYCKIRIGIDVFCELKLAKWNAFDRTVSLLPAEGKADLASSEILKHLQSLTDKKELAVKG